MRKATIVLSLLAVVLGLLPQTTFAALGQEKFRVYVFTAGNSPASTSAAVKAIRDLGKARGFGVQTNGDPTSFTEENLARFRAVVFLTAPGNRLDSAQESAFEAYFRAGGGYVGIGRAMESDPDWAFLTEVLGTRATTRTDTQPGTIKVADRVHDASKDLPEYWTRSEAWYNFADNVRGFSHVLATVVEEPYATQPGGDVLEAISGGTMGFDHPVAWCKDWQGGRSFYTALGGTAASFAEPEYLSHLGGAIEWAAGVADPVYSDCGATVLANYQQTKVSAPPNLSEPIGFDVLPDGRVIQTDRRGGVRLHDPEANETTILAQIPVYTNSEDGMYGPAIDNDFAENHWVYLYYAPPTVEDVRLSDGSIVTQTTVQVNDPTTPQNESVAPTIAPALSAWDQWIGYFQLSRFKLVDASGGTPAHLDLASEQQILRVPNNRGACCHVAGDIDFDTHGNLWLVTGDDTPAGGGNSGGFGPFNGQLTDERQTLTVSGASVGTFTLTFDGQTTAPIPFPLDNVAIEAALEALSNLTDVGVTGTAASNRTIIFGGNVSATDVPFLTGDASGLTGTGPAISATQATVANGQGINIQAVAGMYNTPHVDARRSAQNTNDLRGKVLRVTVKTGDIAAGEKNAAGGAYTIPSGNLFAPGAVQTRPEIYAMGFRNPFRIQVDKNDVAYITDYSPDSQTPTQFRGPAGTGRVEIVRAPANYGWPLCYRTDLPYYRWDFETSAPLPSAAAPEVNVCDDPSRGPRNDSRWNLEGGPTVEPGLEYGPPITNPEVWYSFTPENNPATLRGTPCFSYYGPNAATTPNCPQLFPELLTGGVGPHGAAMYHYDPDEPDATKLPPYYDGAIFFGEFTRDFLREIRLNEDGQVLKVNNLLSCGAVGAAPTPARPFECDNPMDLQFDGHGHFYLLTYGDGFFNINADAGMYRWDYVKGQRDPIVEIDATPSNGPTPLTVQFSSEGTSDPDPGDSIRYEWDFDGDDSVDSLDPNPAFTYSTAGVYTAKLSVFDSSGGSGSANLTITVGNTAPSVEVDVPVEGGAFAFGDSIPFTVVVTDPEDGTIDCNEVEVTFVLGHDTHGHAQATANGCAGVLPTVEDDVSHGGNVFGVISASYEDHGGAGGVPSLTTVDQVQIRQKRQEVEFVVNQSGTNTAASADVDGGQQRGSLGNGDWLQLNGPFNLLDIDTITFRTSGGTNGVPTGAVEIHLDASDGPIATTVEILGTASATTYASQTFPIADSGTHEYFLVFRSVSGGPGNNFFNLNWIEFRGDGVGEAP
jgi:PKD repeat protein/type 1 glutamine amidotransferase